VKAAGSSALKRLIQFALPVIAVGWLTTGCQTYEQKNKVIGYWRAGQITNAVAEATKQADDNAGNKDAIIWRLEQGATLRAAGNYEASNKAFNQAQEKIDGYEEKAKVRLGQETGALLSNQANLDYEGRSYDGIMVNTYRALNYLALGETEKARPELIRAYQRQQAAVAQNARRIQNAQDEAAQSKDKAMFDKAEKNPGFQAQVQNSLTNLSGVKIYSDYVNPFTVYLDGLYFMANAADASDLERAHKSFERVATFVGNNEYVTQDLAAVNDLIHARPLPPTTYVLFETGCAPVRDQMRIDIPIVFSKVSYVGAAFPTLKPQGNFQPELTVTADGKNYPTKTVASMDGIVALDFKNEMPVGITKTIAATITKAVAAYIANDAARQQNDTVGLLVQMLTAGYQMAVNIADTRTWTTLPKEFQICRFPTPADGKIELSTPNGQKTSVILGAGDGTKIDLTSTNGVQASLNTRGTVTVVYVRSITTGTPLLVSQFKLK
jgi:hypothetical protein